MPANLKNSSGHRTEEGQFPFQSQRRAMPKNIQTTAQLDTFHRLANNVQNSPSQASTVLEQIVQAGFTKIRNQMANICWIIDKAREFQKNIYFCFIDDVKAFDCVDNNKL